MGDKAKILLVDDREENLVALEAVLSSLGQTLVRARSGEEALKALLTDDFAVILLDVVMPGMDGFETASHIKRRDRTRDVPIIFLTAADTHRDHAFRGYAAGAVDYLTKPFDPWVLRAKVSVFVDLHRKNQRLQEQAALLRAGLTGSREGLLDELMSRLAAVEEQVTRLTGRSDGLVAGDGVTQLAHRVARLRAYVDALSAEA